MTVKKESPLKKEKKLLTYIIAPPRRGNTPLNEDVPLELVRFLVHVP